MSEQQSDHHQEENKQNEIEQRRLAASSLLVLKFVPFASAIESAFWVRYCRDKLETIHLNETPIPLRLTYRVSSIGTNNNNNNRSITITTPLAPPRLQCHDHSLLLQQPPPPTNTYDDVTKPSTTTSSFSSLSKEKWTNNECVYVFGDMIGYNTLESFQKVDKNQVLSNYFLERFFPNTTSTTTTTTASSGMTDSSSSGNDQITHETDLNIVTSLNCTILLSYADLKNHSVVYWFGMPTIVPQQSIPATIMPLQPDDLVGTRPLIESLHEKFHAMRQSLLLSNGGIGLPPYFIFYRSTSSSSSSSSSSTKCLPLCIESYWSICTEGADVTDHRLQNIYFCFVDPLDTENENGTNNSGIPYMGWPMRNMIAYLSFYLNLGGQDVQIISYRSKVIRRINLSDASASNTDVKTTEQDDRSIVLKVRVPNKDDYDWSAKDADGVTKTTVARNPVTEAKYKIVGWELNARYKPGPRSVNLRPLLDSNHLAIQAADLNLKLMKWRMIPNLQVEELQSTKVLLIGAGTLGCNVARVLLGWGIRHIKILDYGKVSYSNPVRQSLFTINDCNADNGSGRMKAIAAAEALQTIAADVVSEGIVLSIPMPGHPDKEDVIANAVETLDKLIQEADVVYLLTDTRESRWLPTVMCSAYNKILINAALGLDSWLVMRHGAGPSANRQEQLSSDNIPYRLGCYFCSDVVAPENSTKNRTLDQQCTVTRPGLALIASSMAVELMVSLLHHPKRICAPAPKNTNKTNAQYSPTISSNDDDVTDASSPLGIIPHSIRGSLVSYTMMTPTIPAFQYCTGCSPSIVDSYLQDKMNFVQQGCQTTDGSYLEEVSGLTAFRLAASEKLVDMEGWEDDE